MRDEKNNANELECTSNVGNGEVYIGIQVLKEPSNAKQSDNLDNINKNQLSLGTVLEIVFALGSGHKHFERNAGKEIDYEPGLEVVHCNAIVRFHELMSIIIHVGRAEIDKHVHDKDQVNAVFGDNPDWGLVRLECHEQGNTPGRVQHQNNCQYIPHDATDGARMSNTATSPS